MEYIHRKKRKHPEKRIENWLKKHLNDFENGLVLIGTQYQMTWHLDGRYFLIRFDIVARDKDGNFVIIEVKRRATEWAHKAQLLFYMKKFFELTGIVCRGVIAAERFSIYFKNISLENNISLWDLRGWKNGTDTLSKA